MPTFPRRKTQPMRPDSYRRIARLLRCIADKIERYADSDIPQHRVALMQILRTLARQARHWNERNRATVDGTLHVPPR